MSVPLATTIAAAALLAGSLVIALALVKQTARRRAAPLAPSPTVPAAATDGARRADDRDALLLRLSHDLRAPLGSVVTLCQLLLDGDAGPLSMKQHQYVEVIRRGGQTVLGLVDDMLDLVAIESGRADIEPEALDLTALARQAADAAHPLARDKGIPIQVSVPSRALSAEADPRRLRHVLARMVEHVLAATDHGYVEVGVAPSDDGRATVSVHNTRDGLSEAARRALANPVDLEAPATAIVADGQPPLPLAVAARLARRIGAPIEVRGDDEEGLWLSISVPLASDGVAIPAEERRPKSGTHILVVEDDRAERDQVTTRLEAGGYTVTAVASGAEGLRLMREHPYDAVILDLVMPGMSGLEVLRAARADGRLAHLPFVVLSAMYMTRTERAVLGPGVAGVVRKGETTADELLRAVERALSAGAGEAYPTGDRHV